MEYALTKAFVVKRRPLKETDGLVTLYSLDFGKVKAFGKGIYKTQSKISGHLDQPNLVNIKIGLGEQRTKLFSALTIENYPKIKNNALKLKAALFLLKLIDVLISEPLKDDKIFSLIFKTFEFLNRAKKFDAGDLKSLKIWLGAKVLDLIGYGESWRCQKCGKKLSEPIFYFQDQFFCRLHRWPKARELDQKDFAGFYRIASSKEFKSFPIEPPKFSWQFLNFRIRKIVKGLL